MRVLADCDRLNHAPNAPPHLKPNTNTKSQKGPRRADLLDRVLGTLPPRMHRWLLARFPEPGAWLAARQRFARTAAAWSMVRVVFTWWRCVCCVVVVVGSGCGARCGLRFTTQTHMHQNNQTHNNPITLPKKQKRSATSSAWATATARTSWSTLKAAA
jgi:hypothetical protein